MTPAPHARLVFLDWTRGLAALLMLQGHVFHSFTRTDLHEGGPYMMSQFVAGLAPAIFLFLTGATLAFLMHRKERQGATAGARLLAALRRGGYLLSIAFLFRLQLWLFGWPNSPASDLWKVDILNCMGAAMLLLAVLSLASTTGRVRYGAILGVAIAAASPLSSLLDRQGLPALLKDYLAPDYQRFSLFPWAAFLAFGMSAGSILRLAQPDHLQRIMQWAALLGFGLILGGKYFANLPYSPYSNSEFWLNSPILVFMKLGVILLVLAFAFLWTRYAIGPRWSWITQLGATSLLVYWVHIELVYGRWFGSWKESFTVVQSGIATIAVTALMLALSLLRTNWRNISALLRYSFSGPRRVSGD